MANMGPIYLNAPVQRPNPLNTIGPGMQSLSNAFQNAELNKILTQAANAPGANARSVTQMLLSAPNMSPQVKAQGVQMVQSAFPASEYTNVTGAPGLVLNKGTGDISGESRTTPKGSDFTTVKGRDGKYWRIDRVKGTATVIPGPAVPKTAPVVGDPEVVKLMDKRDEALRKGETKKAATLQKAIDKKTAPANQGTTTFTRASDGWVIPGVRKGTPDYDKYKKDPAYKEGKAPTLDATAMAIAQQARIRDVYGDKRSLREDMQFFKRLESMGAPLNPQQQLAYNNLKRQYSEVQEKLDSLTGKANLLGGEETVYTHTATDTSGNKMGWKDGKWHPID